MRTVRSFAGKLGLVFAPRGVRVRLTLLVLLAMAPGFALALYGAAEARRRDRFDVQQEASRLARLTAITQERTLDAAEQFLRSVPQSPVMTSREPVRCGAELRRLLSRSPGFQSLSWAQREGRVVCSSTSPPAAAVASAPWFQRSLAGETFSVERFGDSAVVRGILVAALGVGEGTDRGVLFATLDSTRLNELLHDVQLPEGTSVNLIDAGGVIVSRHPDPEQWVGRNVSDVGIIRFAMADGDGSLEAAGLEGTTRLFGFYRLRHSGLLLTLGIPRDAAFARSNERLKRSLLFLGATGVLTLTLAWFGSQRLLLRPVGRLVAAARRMGAGDFSARIGLPSHGRDELSELSEAFDSMAANLQAHEREIQQAAESLRALAVRTENIREQERTDIAREIHDQLGQHLTALRMDVDWIVRALAEDRQTNPLLDKKLAAMAQLLDVTVPLVRNISRRLRPGILDALGLRAAVEWQVEDFQDRTGYATDFVCALDDSQLSPDHATVLFRILQEALTNIIRHAAATSVTVHLAQDANGAILEISDNGIGLSPEAAARPRALGLLGMRERAHAVGGRLTIHGTAGRGTTVAAWVPLR